jgi:Domain of unknown function (DUF4328)
MTDIWVCSTCNSVNRQRSSSCYKCHAPQTEATGAMADRRIEAAVVNRTVARYRSSWLLFMIASVLIAAMAVVGIAILLASLSDVDWYRAQIAAIANGAPYSEAAFLERSKRLAVPGLAHLGLAVLALVTFATWLSRVFSNIPVLGGGTPGTTPTKALVYPLIPIWNLIKTPGMIQDALYRLDPKAGGFFMVLIAWIGLVGSWIVSFIAGWVLEAKVVGDLLDAETAVAAGKVLQGFFDASVVVSVVTDVMVAGGAVVLILVMARIERRSRHRDAEIKAMTPLILSSVSEALAEA